MTTVTVIIPALNEAKTLPHLLADLQHQELDGLVSVSSIAILSDGSTDDTDTVVQKFAKKDKKLVLSTYRKRLGKAARLNQAFRKTTTDIAIVLDADIRLKNKHVLQRLISPILIQAADLTSVEVRPLKPITWIQKMLSLSAQCKQTAYAFWRSGNNIFTCHGRIRAFSKRLYSHIHFQHSYNEDSFSYLYCISHGMKYQYVANAQAYYKLPTIFHDHLKQSQRFFVSTDLLYRSFPESLVKKELAIPKKQLLLSFLVGALHHPILMSFYTCGLIYTYFKAHLTQYAETWDVATSTK